MVTAPREERVLVFQKKNASSTVAKLIHHHHHGMDDERYLLLPPFQIVGRFGFSRFIVFAMHLDIIYV